MAAEKSLSTPTAILIAGALIAAGLFFGLRGREPSPVGNGSPAAPAQTAASPGSGAAASPPGPQLPQAAPAPPPNTPDRAAVTAQAMKDLDQYRADIVKKCVEPALALQPKPPQIKLTFNVTFDAQGKQIARGVSEDRATMRPGVSMCAMDAIPELKVPPPGNTVQVDLPWTLP